jgi:uncharacterized protein YndB with AHSA1/START domain
MITFEGTTVVHAPIEDVFAFVSNPANIPSYQDKVVSAQITSHGPVGKGTQFEETVQMGPGKMHVTCSIVAYEPARRVAFAARSNMVHCDAEYAFEATPEGTRVRITGAASLQGWRKLLEPLMRGQIRGAVPRELELIRERVAALGKPRAAQADARRPQAARA